jgi:hypothetical protein
MIDEPRLLDGLTRLLDATQDNIRRRCDDEPAVNQPLQERYDAARKAGRTGLTFNVWRENEITQASVAWLLACVFVRFLEDNGLLDDIYLAGREGRTRAAQERRTHWYRANPRGNDREYLFAIFADLVLLPGMRGLLDRDHNQLWSLGPDGDGAKAIIDFFQSTDPDSGLLRHDFTDTARNTRFLGDLYQNISESARKRYALLQTPDFIVDFILDRTMTPALDEFGLDGFRLIDPACGSGHFLLAAFDRLFRLWADREGDLTVVVRNALDCTYGVDLNPYAAAIARFRLLIAALVACKIDKLKRAEDWQIHVTTGDSLLFGPGKMVPSMTCLQQEDPEQLRLILQAQGYHVVVGNPPYINVQDPELRRLYRAYYKSCSGKYQISVPFTELFFDVAEKNGYVGMITSNAFMKRSFGRALIEKFLPKWDMTHVIDTSVAHVPGHGTPTAILLGRNRFPLGTRLRVVRGIRGEPAVPDDAPNAPVWTEIRRHVDQPGYDGRYLSVADAERKSMNRHPWTIGGGGAAELKERLDDAGEQTLSSFAFTAYQVVTGADEVFQATVPRFRPFLRPVADGRRIADWHMVSHCILSPSDTSSDLLWQWRTVLANRLWFGQRHYERGLPWWSFGFVAVGVDTSHPKIAYGEVDTHASFVYNRGGVLFDQTAPVLSLRAPAPESQYMEILGLMNSSTPAFWLRQVCRNKGMHGQHGGLKSELWEQFFAFNGTNVGALPFPAGRPLELAIAIQSDADERSTLLPSALVAREAPTRASLDAARERADALLLRMIALQEELDWQVYHLYGLLDESFTLPIDQIPPVRLGERAFEIAMARAIQSGELETEWFARHRSTPHTEIPDHWSAPYRDLVQRRLDSIARDRDIALIEQPEHKRRWNLPAWKELEKAALSNWLLDRLEDSHYWPTTPPALTTVARLADALRHDSEFLQVAELYRGRTDFDVVDLVEELVAKESVPFLPVFRYKDSGLRKRADWEHTWALQRREDDGEKVEIPVPPKYEKGDFLGDFWRQRGKLDVPKERWISYPSLARDADKSLVIACAGYDHGQQAIALAAYCYEMRSMEGWTAQRLTPILAGLLELQPWLDQWHNEIDPERQQRLNEFVRGFVDAELAQLGLSEDEVRAWRPSAPARAGRRKKQ